MILSTAQETIAFTVVDSWLDYRIRYSDLAGLQVAIRRKGELVFSKAYGLANVQTGEAYTTAHLGRIASHSKMFTSCALHMLEEDGALRLDQPALEFLPELRSHKDKRFGQITIRDLLTNRSGLLRDGPEADFWDLIAPFPNRERLLREIMQADLVYDPNTVTKYSNYGFSLLCLVIEAASGMSFRDFVQTRILDRLPGASIYPEYSTDLPMAAGHSKALFKGKRRLLKHASSEATIAAAGFCANAESISLFVHQLLCGDLVPETLRRELLHLNWLIQNSETERYGLGIAFNCNEKIELIGHGGGYPGFTSQTRYWLGTDYVISFILNSNELFGLELVTSIAEIIQKISQTFGEVANAIVTDVMTGRWGSVVYVVAEDRALGFNLDLWSPCKAQTVMERNGTGYVTHKMNGFSPVGEPTKFQKNEAGQIVSLNIGGLIYRSEADFLSLANK